MTSIDVVPVRMQGPSLKKREDYPKAKAELEAEAVPSEPSIRSAEAGLLCYAASRCHYSQTPYIASVQASPVSRSSEYGDEAFEAPLSDHLA